jgi:hypothetical protein
MKPKLLLWMYLGLFYILALNSLDIVIYFNHGEFENFPVMSAILSIAAMIAAIGLAKRSFLIKIATLVVIIGEVLSTFVTSIYLYSVMPDMGFNLLTSFFVSDTPLIFLAYKTYTSEAVNFYFSK